VISHGYSSSSIKNIVLGLAGGFDTKGISGYFGDSCQDMKQKQCYFHLRRKSNGYKCQNGKITFLVQKKVIFSE
jgi:hypothetical protein